MKFNTILKGRGGRWSAAARSWAGLLGHSPAVLSLTLSFYYDGAKRLHGTIWKNNWLIICEQVNSWIREDRGGAPFHWHSCSQEQQNSCCSGSIMQRAGIQCISLSNKSPLVFSLGITKYWQLPPGTPALPTAFALYVKGQGKGMCLREQI